MKRFGWVRDLLDQRDKYFFPKIALAELPPKFDNRDICPPVFDQGELGSCVAQAVAAGMQMLQIRDNQPQKDLALSRLFIYWYARLRMGTIPWDSGCRIRDAIKGVNREGAALEERWPYNIKKYRRRPPLAARINGYKNQLFEYRSIETEVLIPIAVYTDIPETHETSHGSAKINNSYQIKAAIAQRQPIVLGVMVYEGFIGAVDGVIPMPGPEDPPLGGHAIMLIGYDDGLGHYIFRNSWGEAWGIKGNGKIPYEYIHDPNLTADIWALERMED